jgi:hypothetical protein
VIYPLSYCNVKVLQYFLKNYYNISIKSYIFYLKRGLILVFFVPGHKFSRHGPGREHVCLGLAAARGWPVRRAVGHGRRGGLVNVGRLRRLLCRLGGRRAAGHGRLLHEDVRHAGDLLLLLDLAAALLLLRLGPASRAETSPAPWQSQKMTFWCLDHVERERRPTRRLSRDTGGDGRAGEPR